MTDRTISRLEAKIAREARFLVEKGLRSLIATPEGRAYFWSILGLTGILSNPFTVNALNTAFACGEQNVGQKLLDQLTRIAPDAYILMMKEGYENDRLARERLDRAARGDPDSAEPDADD